MKFTWVIMSVRIFRFTIQKRDRTTRRIIKLSFDSHESFYTEKEISWFIMSVFLGSWYTEEGSNYTRRVVKLSLESLNSSYRTSQLCVFRR